MTTFSTSLFPKFFWLTLASLIPLCLATITLGQFKSTSAAQSSDLRVSVGVGFDWSGFQTQHNLQLVDRETGIAYDVFSLTRHPQIRRAVHLDDGQVSAMHEIKLRVAEEVRERLAAVVVDDEQRLALEQYFAKASEEALDLMTDEQRASFQYASNRHHLQQVGWQKFLKWKHPEVQLSEDQAKRFEEISSKASLRKSVRELQALANQKLIASLPETAKRSLESLIDEATQSKWCKANMINDRDRQPATDYVKLKKRMKLRLPVNHARVVTYRKSVQQALQLDGDQLESLDRLRQTVSDENNRRDAIQQANLEVAKLLTIDQLKCLNAELLPAHAEKYGTLCELSYGELANQLKLTPEQRERMFEKGIEIYEALLEEIQEKKQVSNRLWQRQLESLPAETRQKLEKLFGNDVLD